MDGKSAGGNAAHSQTWMALSVCSIALRALMVIIAVLAYTTVPIHSSVKSLNSQCIVYFMDDPAVDITVAEVSGALTVSMKGVSISSEASGPCGFPTRDIFLRAAHECSLAEQAYCCDDFDGCRLDIPDDMATKCDLAEQYDVGSNNCDVPFHNELMEFEDGRHSATNTYAVILLVLFVVISGIKCRFVSLEYHGHSWTREAKYKTSKGFVHVVMYYILTVSSNYVIRPLADIKTYGEDEMPRCAEIKIIPELAIVHAMFALVSASILLEGNKWRTKLCGESRPCCDSLGWFAMWVVPGLLTFVGLGLILVEFFVTFSLPKWDLIFTFNFSFALAIYVDVVQILIGLMLFCDAAATLLGLLRKAEDKIRTPGAI